MGSRGRSPLAVRLAGPAAALVVLLGLAACTGDETDKASPTRTASAAERLAAVKARTDAAGSLHLRVTSQNVPRNANGVIGADGIGTHAPAFKGKLDARIAGLQAKVDVVAVGGKLFLKLPFTSSFAEVDPKTYNAPDPATLFSGTTGITSLLPATVAPALGEQKRVGSEVVRTVTGTLPGQKIVDLLNVGDAAGTFQVVYGFTEPGDQLRTATVTGPFFDGATSTYIVTLDRYGDKVDIPAP